MNSLYNYEYLTRWEFNDTLQIKEVDSVVLSSAEGTEAFAGRLGLENKYEAAAAHKALLNNNKLLVSARLMMPEENDFLVHILSKDIQPTENKPDNEAVLLQHKSTKPEELPPVAEFALTEEDVQLLGFSLDSIAEIPLEGISAKETNVIVLVGETAALEVVFQPANATDKSLQWKSESPGIASVDNKGIVSGNKTGKTKITAVSEDGGHEAVFLVEVKTIIPPAKPLASVSGDALFTLNSGENSLTFYGNGMCAINATYYYHAAAGAWPFYTAYTTSYYFSGEQLVLSGAGATIICGLGIFPDMPFSMNHSVAMAGGGATVAISGEGHSFGTYSLSPDQVELLKEISGQVGKPEIIEVEAIIISDKELIMEAGTTKSLMASIIPANATNQNLIWTSSNNNVATITAGTIKALSEGTAIITVSTESGEQSAACTVTVVKQNQGEDREADISLSYNSSGDAPTITTLEFYLESKSVKVSTLASSMYQLDYETTYTVKDNKLEIAKAENMTAVMLETLIPVFGEFLPIELTTDAVHTVTAINGQLTLNIVFGDAFLGEFTIDKEAQNKLGIIADSGDETIEVVSVSLSEAKLTLEIGAAKTLVAGIVPDNASNKKLSWSTTNDNVATVTDGNVLAVSEGTATITVTTEDGKKTAACVVTVIKQNQGEDKDDFITLSYNSGEGDTSTITTAEFSLDSKKIKINSLASGIYQLDYETTYAVTENKLIITDAESVTANMLEALVPVFGTFLPVEITANSVHTVNDSEENLTLSVLFNGEVGLGEFTIDKAVQEKLGIVTTGSEETITVESVSLSKNELTLKSGAVETLDVNISPVNASNKKVTWTSSNINVVTVSDGELTAVAEGTATITVTTEDGKKTATCTVTVKNETPVEELAGDIILSYNSNEGDTSTVTKVAFYLDNNKLKLSTLASGMYQLDYETTYTVSDNKLIIADAESVTANMLEALVPTFGTFLPLEIKANSVHTVNDSEENLTLSVLFNGEVNLGEFTIDKAAQEKLGIVPQEINGDIEAAVPQAMAYFAFNIEDSEITSEPITADINVAAQLEAVENEAEIEDDSEEEASISEKPEDDDLSIEIYGLELNSKDDLQATVKQLKDDTAENEPDEPEQEEEDEKEQDDAVIDECIPEYSE